MQFLHQIHQTCLLGRPDVDLRSMLYIPSPKTDPHPHPSPPELSPHFFNYIVIQRLH